MENAISWRELKNRPRQSSKNQTLTAFFNGIIAAFALFTFFILIAQLT